MAGGLRFRIGRLTCDHGFIDDNHIPAVQALIRTLFDILMMRKGPDSIPHSWLLFYASVLLWFFPLLVASVLVPNFRGAVVAVSVASWIVSLVCYALVIVLAGFKSRSVQALTAVIGCGALIFLAQVAGLVFLTPFLGTMLAQIVIYLLLFWSVQVKGHIIARTIDREWYVGFLIAIGVFVLQYAFSTAVTPAR